MDPSASPGFDPNALTFRNYLSRPLHLLSTSPSIPVIPSYQELSTLQQELWYLSEKASLRHEKYTAELSRLDGGSNLQSKDSSLSSTPASSASIATFNSASQGLSHVSSVGANASSVAARSSASPNTSSPSSFSGSRAGGSSSALTQGAGGGNSPSVVKLGVVTLKLKRSDAAGTIFLQIPILLDQWRPSLCHITDAMSFKQRVPRRMMSRAQVRPQILSKSRRGHLRTCTGNAV